VVGGTAGIGKAIAFALARAGADAIATDAGFNRVIPVGGQVSFGFSGWNLQAPRSTEFTVNGAMCR